MHSQRTYIIFETGFDSFINYVIQGEFPIEIKTEIRYSVVTLVITFLNGPPRSHIWRHPRPGIFISKCPL